MSPCTGRLWASADRLGMIAAAFLAGRYPEAAAGTGEPRLVAVDATTVVSPGDRRERWLMHTVEACPPAGKARPGGSC